MFNQTNQESHPMPLSDSKKGHPCSSFAAATMDALSPVLRAAWCKAVPNWDLCSSDSRRTPVVSGRLRGSERGGVGWGGVGWGGVGWGGAGWGGVG